MLEFIYIIGAILVFAIFSIAISILSYKIGNNKKTVNEINEKILLLQKDIKLLCDSNIGLGRTMFSFEKKLNDIIEYNDTVENEESKDVTYSHASKMVELGANIEEVASTCGLTQSEVELVKVLSNHESSIARKTDGKDYGYHHMYTQ